MVQDVGAKAGVVMSTKGDMIDFDSVRQRLPIGSTGQVLAVASALPTWSDASSLTHSVALEVACSDEDTALTTGTAKVTFRMPYAMTLNSGTDGVRGGLTTAGTGANLLTVDINEGGSTILTTKLTFDATETETVNASTPVVVGGAGPALADNAEMTVDIDQIDSGGVSAGLKIILIGTLA